MSKDKKRKTTYHRWLNSRFSGSGEQTMVRQNLIRDFMRQCEPFIRLKADVMARSASMLRIDSYTIEVSPQIAPEQKDLLALIDTQIDMLRKSFVECDL